MHTALWCLTAVSLVGAAVSAARPKEVGHGDRRRAAGGGRVSATAERTLRIGELAELTGTTPRTIRYYEEIGLLGGGNCAHAGQAPLLHEADVDRVREVLRLRDLLGLSPRAALAAAEAESARADLRREYQQTESAAERKRILESSLRHIGTQLDLVRGRLSELTELADELEDKRKLVKRRIRENS